MKLARILVSAVLALLLLPGTALPREQTDAGLMQQLAQALPQEQMQEVRFLQHLGWRFVRDGTVKEIKVEGGMPCRYDTLSAAQQAGALRIRFPSAVTAKQLTAFGATTPSIVDSAASRCAYKHKIAIAVNKVVARMKRITEAGRYKFPEIVFGIDSPWWKVRMPQPEWEKRGRVWYASGSATRAMKAIYRRGAVAECYSGQAVAVYAIQYALYGPAAFDKVFHGDDLALGRPKDIKATPIGKFTNWYTRYPWRALVIPMSEQRLDPIFPLAKQGRMAFVGLSGIVRNQKQDTQSNENWILTSISQRALDDIVEGGGLKHISKRMQAIWAARGARGKLFRRGSGGRGGAAKVEQILAEPVFTEVMLYVHPFGNISLGDIVRKKLDKVDTPLEFIIYTHGREDALYQRYREAFKKGWLTAPTRPARPN